MFLEIFADVTCSTSARHPPFTPPPLPRSDSYPVDPGRPSRRGRPKKTRRKAAHPKHKRDNLPDTRLFVIDCGWTGCGLRLQHEPRSVKHHVMVYHLIERPADGKVTCRWVRKDTGRECGSTVLWESIIRHTLSVHTNLLLKQCECGKRFRPDTFHRHSCEGRENKNQQATPKCIA
jgi:hypothetical protein